MPLLDGRAAVVARDEAMAGSLELLLKAAGLEVAVHARPEDFLAAPHAAFLFIDDYLQRGAGLGLVTALRRVGWEGLAVIMVEQNVGDLGAAPGVVYLEKPFVAGDIMALLTAAGAVPP